MGKNRGGCVIVQSHEERFGAISEEMKTVDGIDKEAECAERMKKELGALLKCGEYAPGSIECRRCHTRAERRRDAVRLVMKAQRLEREMGRASLSAKGA